MINTKSEKASDEPQPDALKAADYVHLHNHTHHSLLDGLTKTDELVNRVKDLGMDAVAMTDHGTMSGAVEFYKAAKEKGIKPIIGIETYIASRTIHDRDPAKDKARYHLILLAMNNTGYQNLMKLSTIANLEGMYYKARLDHSLLEKYNEGLIVLSGCAGGELGENLTHGNYEEAKRIAAWYKSVFKDRYYLEVQDHEEWKVQISINQQLFKLGNELDIQCVITSDAHYLNPESREAHEILLCVGTGAYLADQDRMSLKEFKLHVTDPVDIIKRWGKDHKSAITNTRAIADRCEVELSLGKILIPKFPVPKSETEKSYLHKLVWQGLAWRYGGISELKSTKLNESETRKTLSKKVIERAEYELKTIDNMNFNGFFLIVADFIVHGKKEDIFFGPGRGSAASSIVSYSLKITELDPLEYNLLFERFLNPDRISMPDFDIDIQDTRRDEVINYCINKYGENRVANIVTFGKMAARAAIRDVARVLQVPYAEADHLAKLIPQPIQGRHIPLKVSIEKDAELKKEYQTNPTAKKVIDFAIILEGTIRSHGVHAAGVVIAPDDIVKFTPLEMAQKGVVATQYSMGPIEELGILKIDFLGLSNLTIIKNSLRIIKKVYGEDIDVDHLPLNDAKTFSLLARGDTTGVFQLESAGMKRFLKELVPNQFADIIAMVALYRPGPMAEFPRFIAGKKDTSTITYPHPSLEPVLKETYGVMVFQEQIIALLQLLAGYSPGEADLVRKAIGKKKRDIMQAEHPRFIKGCQKKGLTKVEADRIWTLIQPFADYSFNKAHAACYATIAYQTAYLKANYPDAFMAALMTSDQDNIDRLAIEISECKHMGIKVLLPDVNESFVEFGIIPGQSSEIRFGMAAIKGVGTGVVEEILRARAEDGPFTSIESFAKRVNGRTVNRKVWENLIKAGAFDSIGDRSDLLFNLDSILGYASKLGRDSLSGQADLFGGIETAVALPAIKLEPAPSKHPTPEKLKWERDLLGLYLSSHPLDRYNTLLDEGTKPLSSLAASMDNKPVVVGGIISTIRQIVTKNGSKMAFIGIEDKTGESEIIVFPSVFEKVGIELTRDAVIRVKGKVNARGRDGAISSDVKVLADEITVITEDMLDDHQATSKKQTATTITKSVGAKLASSDMPAPSRAALKKLYVHVKNPDDQESLLRLKQTFNNYPGQSEIILVLGSDKESALRLPFNIEVSTELQQQVASLYGQDCVAVR